MISEAIPTIVAALGFIALALSLWQSRSLNADNHVEFHAHPAPEQRTSGQTGLSGPRTTQRPNVRFIRRLSIAAALLYLAAAMLQTAAEHGVQPGITSTWTAYFLAMIVAFVNAVVITRRSFPRLSRPTAAPPEAHDGPAQWTRKCNEIVERGRYLLDSGSDRQAQSNYEPLAAQVQGIIYRGEASLNGQDRKMLRVLLPNIRYVIVTSGIQAAESESRSPWPMSPGLEVTAGTLSAIAQLSNDITKIIAELDALAL